MKTSIECLQWGHVIRSVFDGARRISSSQALHLKCIVAAMKPLVLLLLVAVFVQAQTVADVARTERERQARIRNEQALRGKATETITNTPAAAPAAAPAAPATPDPGAPSVPATPAVPDAARPAAPSTALPVLTPSPVDPAAKWNDEIAMLRVKAQELQDQERALQLQVNQLTNQIFAPVSDQTSRDQAQGRLGETQNRLMAVRAELDQTKKTLDAMQLQGPPKQ